MTAGARPERRARSAVITGAGRGIGRACAEAFAGDGWALVLVDRDPAALRETAGALGEAALALPGEVTDRAVNQAAVALARARFGGLDAAVANAGVALSRLIDDTSDEDFDRMVAVNVRAVMYLAQAAHGPLRASRGSFVVVASKTGLVAQAQSPVYCATKGAAVQLARALALDWAPESIRVNAVCPGIVDTPMLAEFVSTLPDPRRAWEEHRAAQPLGRLATPAECASAVLFLASPAASFITGVALPVDGGFTAA